MSDDRNLCDFVRHYLMRVLLETGIEQGQAEQLAVGLERELMEEFGGDRPYIPSYRNLTKQQRDREIVRAWKSNPDRNLIAGRYGVHRTTVDRAINRHLSMISHDSGFGRAEWNL